MKNKILWFISALPLIVTGIVLKSFPDEVPMHYDFSGNIDRWGSKNEQFIFPVIILCMTLFWQIFITFYSKKQTRATEDKERQEAKKNQFIIYIAAFGTTIQFAIMHFFFLYSAWLEATTGSDKMIIDINMITFILLGILLVILGNFMPKAKKNAAFGLRTVWSMENDQTWAASQRAGGKALIAAGILIVICSLILDGITLIAAGLFFIVAASVVAVIYSHKAYVKYKDV